MSLSDQLSEMLSELGSVLVWIVLLVGMYIAFFHEDKVRDVYYSLVFKCEKAEEELLADFLCVSSPNCTMSREEMAEFEQRKLNIQAYCADR